MLRLILRYFFSTCIMNIWISAAHVYQALVLNFQMYKSQPNCFGAIYNSLLFVSPHNVFLVVGEHTNYETDGDGNRTFSEGEGDTSRADDPDSVLSPKKEKKKKVLKTPSFLKKKKKDKKEKEKA